MSVLGIGPLSGVASEVSSSVDVRRAGARAVARADGGAAGTFERRLGEARQAAEELVSSAFVKPLLGELRRSSMGVGAFKPGVWERRMGPIADAAVAERIVRAGNWGLVESIAERFVGSARASWMSEGVAALKPEA